MAAQELIDYIKKELAAGKTREEITQILLAQGWPNEEIAVAFPPLVPQPDPAIPSPAVTPPGNSQALPGVEVLLKEAWGIFKDRWKTFLGVVLIPSVFGTLVIALFFVLGLFSLPSLIQEFEFSKMIWLILAGFVVTLFLIIIQLWGQTAILCAVVGYQEKIGLKEAYRRGWKKIGPILGLSLLYGLVALGGFSLLIIPLFIFMVWFSFGTLIVIAGDERGLKALLKSREYVRGHWWSVVGRMMMPGLLFLGLYMGIGAFQILVEILIKSDSISLILSLLSGLVGFLVAPLVLTYQFILYEHLKRVKGEVTIGKKTWLVAVIIWGLVASIGGSVLIVTSLVKSFQDVAPFPYDGSSLFSELDSQTDNSSDLSGPGFLEPLVKSRDIRREVDIASIKLGLSLYAAEHQSQYPTTLEELVPNDLRKIPSDPKTQESYEYRLLLGGKDYELCANFEEKGRECSSSVLDQGTQGSPPAQLL